MTIDDKLARLEQEIDSLDSAIGLMPEGQTGSGAQTVRVQIAARFESCEMVLKSLRRDITNKDEGNPIRANVLFLRDRLSALLDKYEAQSDSE